MLKNILIGYLIGGVVFPLLHQWATIERMGRIAFGGEAALVIIAPLLLPIIADTLKGLKEGGFDA